MKIELSNTARDLINKKLKDQQRNVGFVCRAESLDHASLYRFLKGHTNRASFETVARAMRSLGITMMEVFGDSKLPKGE